MGSVGICVTPEQKTRTVVEQYIDEYRGDRTVLDSSWQSTGEGRYTHEWSYVLYQAVRDNCTGEVSMWVTLSARGGGQVYIKALHEEMGPGQSERCPERLLNLLTPTSNEYAAEWREQAGSWHRRRRAAKTAVGKTVTFERPWNYQRPMSVFSVLSEEQFRGEDGLLYRAPRNWWMAPHSVSPEA